MEICDLRSDTVTRPSAGMRAAMASAEVGDDVYGEDPTVAALELRVAELLGKERALFVPSGTMANQLALMLHTRRGDEVVMGEGTHLAWFEAGAAAALSGVQPCFVGRGGLFTAEELAAAVKPSAYYLPRTSLVVVENTHNRSGGRVFPLPELVRIRRTARELGLGVHLDGARLWNASVASGVALSEYAALADTVSVCFSKGLGAPVGSALVGSAELVGGLGLRYRRMLGGSMRQSGIVAAAALYALEHHLPKLGLDHEKARRFAEIVAQARGAEVDLATVETNIVNVRVAADTDAVVKAAKARGVLISSIAPGTLRAVTHLDVSLEAVERAAARLVDAIESVPARGGRA
jgi:threonine aldolase